MEYILELNDVHTYFGESHILHGVSMKVKTGSVAALLGRNGMGKTTTLHSIIGMAPPRKGNIYFKGQSLCDLEPHQIPRTGIALVPQGRRIFPSLSVRENLTIGAVHYGKGEGWTLEKIYSLFPVLEKRSGLRGNQLSGGEQQMLAIGRALMTNPEMLLMDEPSEGLAPLIVQNLAGVIDQLHRHGLSVLLVEQNLQLALALADYVYVMNKGMIVYESPPSDLKQNEEVVLTYLGVSAG